MYAWFWNVRVVTLYMKIANNGEASAAHTCGRSSGGVRTATRNQWCKDGYGRGSTGSQMFATSSRRGSCWGSPTGWMEMASAAAWRTPGMWTIRKRYRSDFSLRLRRRVFGMSFRERSPRVLRRGLWSTAAMRSDHPMTKWRALSKASITARASPSIGAYQDLAPDVKRLPTRVIFQPGLQQNGLIDVQEQCFWNSQKPIPSLLQSVARQVGRVLSKNYCCLLYPWKMGHFSPSSRKFGKGSSVDRVHFESLWLSNLPRIGFPHAFLLEPFRLCDDGVDNSWFSPPSKGNIV